MSRPTYTGLPAGSNPIAKPGETIIRTDTDTIIIPGSGISSKEQLDSFVTKTKIDYKEALDYLLSLIPQMNKKPQPKPLPQVSPFLDTPLAPPTSAISPANTVPTPDADTKRNYQTGLLQIPDGMTPSQAAWFAGIKKPPPPPVRETPATPVIPPSRPKYFLVNSTALRSHLTGEVEGRVVSVTYEESRPVILSVIASIFFLITFSYTSLTLLSFGLILALAIALNHAGTPGFDYLFHYPAVGLLPIITCLATIVFMYVGYKVRDGSRLSWLLGISSLSAVPLLLTFILPSMTYPLIRLVSVYAGTATSLNINTHTISLPLLKNFFSIFLFFEAGTLLFIIFFRDFRFKNLALSGNAITSLLVMIFMFLIPISTVVGYGYIESQNTDYGQASTQAAVNYRLYVPDSTISNRTNATRYSLGDNLAGNSGAVSADFDLPLPVRIKSGDSSRITLIQVQTAENFSLRDYLNDNKKRFDEPPAEILLPAAYDSIGFKTVKNSQTEIWLMKPDNILLYLASPIATEAEIIDFSQTLK
jgi:hypothetical protein